MAVERISEKQFRTRRRDRRMVWVDAVAFLVGLIVVAASVGGVIFYETPVEPIEWTPAFLQTTVFDNRTCYGYEGGGQAGEACRVPINTNPHQEGEDVEVTWPAIAAANVTSVMFTLRWLDELPPSEGDCFPPDYKYECPRYYEYDENSTAILRLQVHTPWGEVIEEQRANNWENVTSGTGDGVPSATIRIQVPVLEIPENASTVQAFSQQVAEEMFNESHYRGDHDALGEWKTVVTVIRASSMNGTVPADACTTAGMSEDQKEMIPNGEEYCDIYEEYEYFFKPGEGDGELPLDYPGFYGIYGNSALNPVRDQSPYRSTYKGEGQQWTLAMNVRGYEVMAGVL